MQKLKKTLAVFCLLVFLFPFVETGIHNYAHANDFHCTANTHHIHKAEHHCSICDFTTDCSASPSFTDYHFELNKLTTIHLYSLADNYLLQSRNFQSLRGPPAMV
jgi:hypothetical protein